MADQFHEFNRVFRDRLRDQTATPPDSVWNNIQAERTFGHIISNKISSSWRIIGTLLLLAMAGGTSALLISQEKESQILNTTPTFEQNDQLSEIDLKTTSTAFTSSINEYNELIKKSDVDPHDKHTALFKKKIYFKLVLIYWPPILMSNLADLILATVD